MNLLFFLLDPLETNILIKFSLAIRFLVLRMHIALCCNFFISLSHCIFSLTHVWSLDPCTPPVTEEVEVMFSVWMTKYVETLTLASVSLHSFWWKCPCYFLRSFYEVIHSCRKESPTLNFHNKGFCIRCLS